MPAGCLGLRRHLPRDQHHREVGRQGAERGDHGLRLLGGPPLDAVGEQVAPRRHQGHRGDRRDQRVGVGRPLPGLGREALQSPGTALALGTGAEAGQRRIDLALVAAGDQVGGLDRARATGASVGARHGRRVYSEPRPLLSRRARKAAPRTIPLCRVVSRRCRRRCRRCRCRVLVDGGRGGARRGARRRGDVVLLVGAAAPPAVTVVVLSPPQAAIPAPAPTPRAIAAATAASRFIALLPVAYRAAEPTQAVGANR